MKWSMKPPEGYLWHKAKARNLFSNEIRTALEDITGTVHTNVFFNTPIASGALRASQQSSVKGREGKVYYVAPGSAYAVYADKGRRPGKQPPIAPLIRWLKSSRQGRSFLANTGGNLRQSAYILARHIGKRGTKGSKFWTEAMKKSKPEVKRISKVLQLRIKKGLQ